MRIEYIFCRHKCKILGIDLFENVLATLDEESTLVVWCLKTYLPISSWKCPDAVSISILSQNLFLTMSKGKFSIWSDGQLKDTFLFDSKSIVSSCVQKCIDSHLICAPCKDGHSFSIFRFKNVFSTVYSNIKGGGLILSIAIPRIDAKRSLPMLIAYESGLVQLWALVPSRLGLVWSRNYGQSPITALVIDHKITIGVAGSASGVLYVFSLDDSEQSGELQLRTKTGISSIEFQKNNKRWAVAGWDGKISLFSRNGKLIGELGKILKSPPTMKFCGDHVYIGEPSGLITLWKIEMST